ncbi:LOW QUALITY PROTEIN: hypothetical protein MCAG_03471, partial [Micromonospora sp. ATCC 39149]
ARRGGEAGRRGGEEGRRGLGGRCGRAGTGAVVRTVGGVAAGRERPRRAGRARARGATEARVTLARRSRRADRHLARPVTRLAPGTEEWTALAPTVAAKRLNAPGPTADLVARWVTDGCALVRLTPAGDPAAGDRLPDASLAEPPRAAPVVRATRRPFRLHRVRRR